VLFKAGDHVPETLFVEVVGSGDSVLPEQTADAWLNVGVTGEFTVTVVALDVDEQLLVLVTTTVYEPAADAV
jgi:hypothetical protein